MIDLFQKGGPMMWPILICSVAVVATIVDRTIFLFKEWWRRDPSACDRLLDLIRNGDFERAATLGARSTSSAARVLGYGLAHRETLLQDALVRASTVELREYQRGLVVLDTIITLAPLLGLLGTVTGMISAFSLLGGSELDAPAAITGGIAEALIATAFGLGIAISSLIPFNFLNARAEEARREIEDRATQLELILRAVQTETPGLSVGSS